VALVGQGDELRRVAEALAERQDVKATEQEAAQAAEELRRGKVQLIVRVEPGNDPLRLTYRFDPMRADSKAARLAVDDALQRALGRVDVIEAAEQTVSEPGARYIDFLIPGLIGLNLMGSSMWGIGYAIALARRRRLLRRLAATPMRRSHYLLAFMLSRIAFLGAELAVLLAVGWLLFDVAVHGSAIALGILALLGAMSFMGVALLVASRTDSTEVAAGVMNAVMLPMWVLSGSFFSYERFPEVVHPLIQLLPLTAFNDALRAVMTDGAPLWHCGPELAVLVACGGVSFLLALRLFRWQ
jgi:ABC transporter DrrB family efflux protein